MIKSQELTNPNSCMNKARDDEMTFVLLGRDKAAPYAIRCWVNERIRLGKNQADDPQVVEALECAKTMEESQADDGRKVPGFIAMHPVESSQIVAIGHCPETNTLAIQFKNWKGEPTTTYHYQNFTADDFAAFKGAESLGKHFGANIKPFAEKYPYTKVEATPA